MVNIIQVRPDVKSVSPLCHLCELFGNLQVILIYLCLFNLFEHKTPSELFTSGKLEHIPTDIKSNYLKPHDLNKEVTRAAALPVAPYVCPQDSHQLSLPYYTVYTEHKAACV